MIAASTSIYALKSTYAVVTCARAHQLGDEIPERDVTCHFATPLAFNARGGQVSLDDLRKILRGGQRMAKVHSAEEILSKASTP